MYPVAISRMDWKALHNATNYRYTDILDEKGIKTTDPGAILVATGLPEHIFLTFVSKEGPILFEGVINTQKDGLFFISATLSVWKRLVVENFALPWAKEVYTAINTSCLRTLFDGYSSDGIYLRRY